MFFFKKSNQQQDPPAYQNEAQRLRGRQIASLIRAGGQAINHDQSQFDVPIYLPDKRVIFLRITLPPRFPVQPPSVLATSVLQHPWIDSQLKVVGHPDLNNWSAHSDLGRIVSEISNEFMRTLPQKSNSSPSYNESASKPAYQQPAYLQPPNLPTTQAYQSTSAAPYGYSPIQQKNQDNTGDARSHEERTRSERVPQTEMPPIPIAFPELEDLTLSQLETIINDKKELKEYVRNMDSVKNFLRVHDEIISGNEEMAQINLEYEIRLEEINGSLDIHKVELHEAKERFAEKHTKQQELLSRYHPRVIVERLNNAASLADEHSESIASKFIHGEMDLDSFLKEYISCRKLYHLRRIKVSRFSSSS